MPPRLIVDNDPGGFRHSGPDTSRLAAGSISATNLELIVHTYLFGTGRELTAFEIACRGLGNGHSGERFRPGSNRWNAKAA